MADKIKKTLLQFLFELKKEHIFLFLVLICSFVLAVLPFLYCIITFYHWHCKVYSFIFLIPFFVILLLTIVANIFHKKYPKLINILMFFINIFIILIIQTIIGFVLLDYYCYANIESIGNEPKYYKIILQNFPQEKIIHFPIQIPANAKNVQLHSFTHHFFGSQELVLKFDTDKQYIQSELEKYKFKSKENTNHYAFSTMGGGKIQIKDFTLFVIDGNLDRWAKNYGIGVNKDFNQILYYYTNPD